MLKLGIRVSSQNISGRGHFERCLAIRNKIPTKVLWFIDYHSRSIKYRVSKLDELYYENGNNKFDLLKSAINNDKINCILLDTYHINTADIYSIRKKASLIALVDEKKNIKADLVICPQPLEFNYRKDIKYLIGPKYAPISDKFNFKKLKIYEKNKILISFGAYDSYGLTLNVIKSIVKLNMVELKNLKIIITLSKDSPIIAKVKNTIKNLSNFVLILDSKNMQDIYKMCNIAIGAPGLSFLERMASGLPSILISQNKFHNNIIDKWVKMGCGIKAENSVKSIQNKLNLLLLNNDLQKKLIVKGKKIVDGSGASRIAKEIIKMVN